jgi:hypothetical protein
MQLRGKGLPIGEFLKRLWADPRFRKIVWYLVERAGRKIFEWIENKVKKNKNEKTD